MKYAEIIKLIEAGYSRDEIIDMQEGEQDNQQDGQQDEKQDGQQDEKQEGQQDDFSGVVEEMKNIFSDFKNELQAMNIMYSQQKQEAETTPEDLIATIINPFDHDKK